MKKLFLLIPVMLFLFSCDTNTFKVRGTLQNAKNEIIYLDKLDEKAEPYDSVKVNQDGEFEFKGEITEGSFFIVRINPTNYVTLFIKPGEKIDVDITPGQMGPIYTVDGSDVSEDIYKISLKHRAVLNKVDSLGKIFQANQQKPEFDSLQNVLQLEYRNIVQDYKTYLSDFIEKKPGSPAALIALYQQLGPRSNVFSPATDMKFFKLINESLTETYPNIPQLKALNQFIMQVEGQMGQTQQAKTPEIGQVAPEISLPTPDGEEVKLSSLRGKYVLLDFWAAWCKPCREENPNLVKNYKQFKDKNFQIYQVSLDQTKEAWVKAIEDDNLSDWIHVSDLKYWKSEAAQKYGVQGIPASFLLDKEGTIIAKNLRGEQLEQKLNEVLQ